MSLLPQCGERMADRHLEAGKEAVRVYMHRASLFTLQMLIGVRHNLFSTYGQPSVDYKKINLLHHSAIPVRKHTDHIEEKLTGVHLFENVDLLSRKYLLEYLF